MTVEQYLGAAYISFIFVMGYIDRVAVSEQKSAVVLSSILGASIVILTFGGPALLVYPSMLGVVSVGILSLVKRHRQMGLVTAIILSLFLSTQTGLSSYAIDVHGFPLHVFQAVIVVAAIFIMRRVTKKKPRRGLRTPGKVP